MEGKSIISGKDLLDRLSNENWSEIIPKLQYYSLNKIKRYPFLSNKFNINNLALHFSDESIKQIWLEERTWNINYYKDLYSLLRGAVDSLIYNFLNSKEIETTNIITDEVEDELTGSTNIESDIIAGEIESEIAKILGEDIDAYNVFNCLKDGLKPKRISEELEIDVKEIYNILKRVDRKLENIRQNLKS